jgi:uncharacterized protein (DUF2147 family)
MKISLKCGQTSYKIFPATVIIYVVVSILGSLLLPTAFVRAEPSSETDSPVGFWETIDDKTGKPTAVVEIFKESSKLFGRIVKVLTRDDQSAVCVACTDDRKNQPIVGMTIIRNIKAEGSEYSGGDILDPDSGVVYRCKMRLEKNGSLLVVRGYIGFAFIGRAQTWHRRQ